MKRIVGPKEIILDGKTLLSLPQDKIEEYRLKNCCLDVPLSDIKNIVLQLDFEVMPEKKLQLIIEWILGEKNKKGNIIVKKGIWQLHKMREKEFILRGETVLPILKTSFMINAILFNIKKPIDLKFTAHFHSGKLSNVKEGYRSSAEKLMQNTDRFFISDF